MKQAKLDFTNILIKKVCFFPNDWKLYYLNFSVFDFEEKATEILKYILPFSVEKHSQGWVKNYNIIIKMFLLPSKSNL